MRSRTTRFTFLALAGALAPLPTLGAQTVTGLGPRGFVENVGQFDERARFVGWHDFGTTTVTRDGMRFRWRDGWATFLTFEGANDEVVVEGRSARAALMHFFRGRDPAAWRTGAQAYDTVVWRDLYPGIDAVVHWSESGLEYDFAVSPGASIEQIVVRVDGVTSVVGDGSGLRLETPVGVIRHGAPSTFAPGPDGRRPIASSIRRIDECRWGFVVAEGATDGYVIDPVLQFATLIGGVSALDRAVDVAYAEDGSVVVAGATDSPDFPVTAGAYDQTLKFTESYVARFLPDGTGLVFCSFVGGGFDDLLAGMALHVDGTIYLAGSTYSTDYPLTPGAVDTMFGGFTEGFVTRLSAQGDALVFSTYLGGTDDLLRDIAVDAAGNAYVCGYGRSADYPVTAGAFDVAFGPVEDAVVSAIDSTGTSLLWSTFLGGTTGGESAFAIAVDSAGSAYVTGKHSQGVTEPTSDFPVTPGAFQTSTKGPNQHDIFVTKFAPDGSTLDYSTFVGGYTTDWAFALAVDSLGQAVVGGRTDSSDFPTTPGAFDTSFNSLIDGFVTKMSADGSSLVWSTILGGNSFDKVVAVDVDAAGSVVAVSQAASTDMIATPDALQSTKPVGSSWGHLAKIDATGATVTFATYLGGSGSVNGIYGVTAGPGGRVACVGDTGSLDFPLTPGAFDTTVSGTADGFVTSFDLCGGAWLAHGAGCVGAGGSAPTLSGAGCPAPGEAVTVSIAGGAPSSLGFLLFAPTTATLPVTGACSLAIGPLIGPVIPLVLSQAGELSFVSTIPVAAPPGVVQIQTAFVDAAAPDGISASNALRVKVAY